MENMYFNAPAKKEEIEALARKLYGEYSGYAQQYLFYYGRELNIGK
jgi:N-glycosylase/DNA lyase